MISLDVQSFDEYKENTTAPIDAFTGKWKFLSNFSSALVKLDGILYPTVEHAYQAAKTLDKTARKTICECDTPNKAKALGNRVTLRENWNGIKLKIMEELLRQKFADHTDDYFKLIRTYHRELIEGNYWKDTYWGVCDGIGTNHLGQLLMKIRDEKVKWGGLM